jgi:hypothetical protein
MRADLPLETMLAVRVGTWRALFAAEGSPRGLAALPATREAISVSDLPTPAPVAFSDCHTTASRSPRSHSSIEGFQPRFQTAERRSRVSNTIADGQRVGIRK